VLTGETAYSGQGSAHKNLSNHEISGCQVSSGKNTSAACMDTIVEVTFLAGNHATRQPSDDKQMENLLQH
jgi:hypothetical protein